MSMQIVHCPKCRAMQPAQERCGVCGARLPVAPGASEQVSGRELAKLALLMVALFGGFVLLAGGAIWLVFWLFVR
jgi:hypothetical protein